MPRSHRLRTGAGAAALVAAMVLAPTAALAAEAPTAEAPTDVVSVAPAATPAAAPTDSGTVAPAPVDPAATDPAPVADADASTGGTVVVGERPAAAAAPAPAATPSATPAPSGTPAPTPSATPTPTPGSVVVVPGEDSEPTVEVFSSIATPGETVTVYAYGFADEDAVQVVVTGPTVTPSTSFTVYSYEEDFVFDSEGEISFDMDIPEDLALGVITVTVSDASGNSESAEIDVRERVPAPTLSVPTDATAGIVTITGADAVPGSAAAVLVADGELVDLIGSFDDENAVRESVGAASGDTSEIPYDTEPVAYDPDEQVAVAIVPVAADGTFTAQFILPAGDFAALSQLMLDDEEAYFSDSTEFAPFSVAEAAAVAPTPSATTPPAVVPAGDNTTVVQRPDGTLAYTGADQGLWIAGAAALLALGTALIAVPRLRRRFGR